jgi:hypothetical protein
LSRFIAGLARTPKWLLGLGALALAFYAFNAVHYGKLPLRIEECEWPPMAEAIFHTGKPVIQAFEAHRIRFTPEYTVDQTPIIGAWHPPLYLYSLAAEVAVVGTHSPYILRAMGMLSLLVSALLLLLIAREITSRWKLIGGIASVLLLIHPYGIQGSLFLDIDTGIYAPLALLVMYLAIRFSKVDGPLTVKQVAVLGTAIALVTWAKMPTTIVLVGVLFVWWLLARRPFRRSLFEAVAFIGLGAALFFSTYALWCKVTEIPFSYTFQVTFAEKSGRLFSEWLVVNHALHWHLRWYGVALILLGFVYLFDLLRNLVRTRRLRQMDLIFLFSAGLLLQYAVLSPTDGTYQGKYAYPGLAGLLLSVTWLLLRDEPKRQHLLAWGAAAALGAIAALLIPDVLTWLSYYGNYGTWGDELRTGLIAGAALALAWVIGGRRGFPAGVLVVLGTLFVAQSIHSYKVDSSPMYPIPDTAEFSAAVADINATVPPGKIVIGPKDIDFYVHDRIIEGEDAFARGDALLAREIVRNPKIVAFARDSFGPPIGPETQKVLERCFTEVHSFGTTASVAYRNRSCGNG